MSDQAQSRDSLIGLEFSHYRILERVGSGGMGVVYRGYDAHLEREVAIKVLNPGTIADDHSRKRFRNEAFALSKLNHPNIATVHDFETHEGRDFLVMEFIQGIKLADRLIEGSLPEKDVIALGIQLAEGLSAAHEHDVVHRDLKPGNLLLNSEGRLKILDFGLAKLRLPAKASPASETLSETSAIAGTLSYMAPEQVLGGAIDARTDIHAAGIVLYEMATGLRPFSAVDRPELISAVLRSAPTPASAYSPRLSTELSRIIGKCLEREPENRYQSAKELAIDLRRLQHSSGSGPSKSETNGEQPTRGVFSHAKMLALLSVGGLLLAVLAGGLWHRSAQKAAAPVVAPSIAVLPFADLSPGHDQEYFSDGLAEEILNDLAKVPNLKVVARTSAFQFKGKNEDLQVIRQKLNVGNVLEGSVRMEGKRVRITAQLIKADDGFHLWSESYDRDLRDVLTVQDDIAKAVTSALQVKLLSGDSPAILPTSRTTSPEAYQYLLQARNFATRMDKVSQQKALEHANMAIRADPRYAAAYAVRAGLTVTSGAGGWTEYSEAIENARRDIEKAIELDPNLADAYRVLSRIQSFADSDCRAAEITLKRALELASGNAENLATGAVIANCLGHQEEAVGLLRQAIALDPLVAGRYRQLAQYLRDLSRYKESHAALEKALDLNPNEVWAHETRGEVYLLQRRPQEALTEMAKEPAGCMHDLGMSLAFHDLGRNEESDVALASLISQNRNACPYQITQGYAYQGDVNKAFDWLNRAYWQHDAGLCQIKTDLLLKNIRGDLRYGRMLKALKLAK
ncbi:MAG: protein kinase [Candidatus Acidiferrum sp.]